MQFSNSAPLRCATATAASETSLRSLLIAYSPVTFAQPMLLVAGHLGRWRAESDPTNNPNDLLLESWWPTGKEPETGLTGRKDDECGNADSGTTRQCRKPS